MGYRNPKTGPGAKCRGREGEGRAMKEKGEKLNFKVGIFCSIGLY